MTDRLILAGKIKRLVYYDMLDYGDLDMTVEGKNKQEAMDSNPKNELKGSDSTGEKQDKYGNDSSCALWLPVSLSKQEQVLNTTVMVEQNKQSSVLI